MTLRHLPATDSYRAVARRRRITSPVLVVPASMKKKMLAKNSPLRLHHRLITSAQKSRSNNSICHEKIRTCPRRRSARHVRPRRVAGANHLYRRKVRATLSADGSPYDFLVIEFKASSWQRFDLGLETPRGRYAKRIGPFAGVWVRAAIPLRFYRQPAGNGVDLAATFNQPRNSYWINIHSSGYGPLTNVSGLTVAMDYPVGSPTLKIRSVTLATNDPGDAVLEGKPLVDEFGQYTHAEWSGKAYSLDELKKNWNAEEAALRATTLTNRDSYGGFLETHAKATGFFRVEQIDRLQH